MCESECLQSLSAASQKPDLLAAESINNNTKLRMDTEESDDSTTDDEVGVWFVLKTRLRMFGCRSSLWCLR